VADFDSISTRAQVHEYLRRALGQCKIKVNLTDEQISDAIDDSFRWISSRVGFFGFVNVSVSGDGEIILPEDIRDDVLEVVKVIFRPPRFFTIDRTSFLFFADQSFFGLSFLKPNVARGGGFSGLVADLQYLDDIVRVASEEESWEYRPEEKKLFIFGSRTAVNALIKFKRKPHESDLKILAPRVKDFFLRYALAKAMERIGRVYRKYSDVPIAGGRVRLGGAELISDAEKELDKIAREIRGFSMPTGIVVG